jgi:hypothetical protein
VTGVTAWESLFGGTRQRFVGFHIDADYYVPALMHDETHDNHDDIGAGSYSDF